MKSLTLRLAAGLCLLALGAASVASAQPRPEPRAAHAPQPVFHHRKGERLNNWRNAPKIDYRRHHLKAPPRGYEWRQVDGDYVMIAVASGVIASIIAGN